MEFFVVQTMSGFSFAAVLFMLASGLSLIFGVMHIVNIAHGGNTSGGTTGSQTVTPIDAMVELVQTIIDAVKAKNARTLVTCHGGATVTPQDVQYLLDNTKGLGGYAGGSTAERLPVEKSITAAVKDFKDTHL